MRLRKTTSRTRHEHEHTKERSLQRYGFEISRRDEKDASHKIRNDKAIFLHRISNRVTVWLVEIRGVEVTVVYDGKRNTIATVLPKCNKYKDRYYKRIGFFEEEAWVA